MLSKWAIWGFVALCWVLPLLATMHGCATSSADRITRLDGFGGADIPAVCRKQPRKLGRQDVCPTDCQAHERLTCTSQ